MEAIEALKKLLEARKYATKGRWYRVEQPWIDSQTPTYLVAGNGDPHGGKQVAEADCDAEDYGMELERVWSDVGFIALAENFLRDHGKFVLAALEIREKINQIKEKDAAYREENIA